MRLATVLTPMSDENLQLAAQCGVTDVVHRYPGEDIAVLRAAQQRIAAFDMRLAVVEGYLPIENIKLGCDDGSGDDLPNLAARREARVARSVHESSIADSVGPRTTPRGAATPWYPWPPFFRPFP